MYTPASVYDCILKSTCSLLELEIEVRFMQKLLDINIRFTLNMAFFAYCVEHFLIDSLIINIIYIRKENDFAKLKIFIKT